ncbi:lipoprotein [Spiroplasma endosymbiont of Polydrusus pterygomalis]|uniref:lipoprotein n=1 Tax=Spiroplasma endosymbiont of Polydrusus pterygomalis TaxID=3139327 RepID=UPI003CCB03AA
MKKILSIIGVISLIGTSTTSLIACNTPQYSEEKLKEQKEKHKIDTNNENIKNHLEWIAPQEKPFNKIDNKWYYVTWRGNKNHNWRIINFKHNELKIGKIFDKYNKYTLELREETGYPFYFTLYVRYSSSWAPADWESYNGAGTYFKSVYRWNLDTNEPNLIVDENSNVKVNE